MPFDGFVTAAVVCGIDRAASGGRIEKIYSPAPDELILLLRCPDRTGARLSLCASPNIPQAHFTRTVKENPAQASAFCMHMRKHLTGAKIVGCSQPDFERVVCITLEATDELGYPRCERLYTEIMGKCSNIILTDADGKIINVIKSVDFTTSSKRQLLPGMRYEAPPPQDKKDPLCVTREEFFADAASKAESEAEKFFLSAYRGFSPLLSRELAYRAGADGKTVGEAAEALYEAFEKLISDCKAGAFSPCIVCDGNKPIEYGAFTLTQYENTGATLKNMISIGETIDEFYEGKVRAESIKQRGSDVLRLLTTAEAHIKKKIANQQTDLSACEEMGKWKLYGDLITANLYRIEKSQRSVECENYYSESGETVRIPLDYRLTPAQNAQKYYKKYNKAKTAKTELTRRIELSRAELEYIYTVFESLAKAEGEEDFSQIRQELYENGYASKMKDYKKCKQQRPKPMKFTTDGGYTVYVGKNNIQNEYLTLHTAQRTDWFFHIKGAPGSHVIMACGDEEPGAEDFTQAARLAAYYSSKREGENVDVDYTRVRYVKKPAGAPTGKVIYSTNYSATVTPDRAEAERLRKA